MICDTAGVYNIHDAPQCNGQMTLDYNTIACQYGMASGNRLELAKPLVDTLGRDDVWAYGHARAAANWTAPSTVGTMTTDVAVFQCGLGNYGSKGTCPKDYGGFDGVEFSCAMGVTEAPPPVPASCSGRSLTDCLLIGPFAPQSGNDYDCSLRSSAGLSTSALIDWQEYTQGRKVSAIDGTLDADVETGYMNRTLFKFLAGVADFYSSYGVKNSSGVTNLPNTCAQVGKEDHDG